MMVLCVALVSQMGPPSRVEQEAGVTKRNGFVPLITSSLELDAIRRNTLEEMCLKYANINLNENCPVCVCHDSGFDADDGGLGCLEQCANELYSEAPERGSPSKGPVIGSLGFDKMGEDSTNLDGFARPLRKAKASREERVRIVGDLNEEDMMNIMDDELPHGEETLYICEKMDPTQLGPDSFNFEVQSGQLGTQTGSSVFTAEKLKTV